MMAGAVGHDPTTFRLGGGCSIQLGYAPADWAEGRESNPLAPCVALSYRPLPAAPRARGIRTLRTERRPLAMSYLPRMVDAPGFEPGSDGYKPPALTAVLRIVLPRLSTEVSASSLAAAPFPFRAAYHEVVKVHQIRTDATAMGHLSYCCASWAWGCGSSMSSPSSPPTYWGSLPSHFS